MFSSSARYFVLLGLCATVALPLHSEEAPPAKQAGSKKPNGVEKKNTPAATPSRESKKLDDLKKMDLPTDAVIVICEHANEALDLVPRAVILTPEKYQAMRDEIASHNKKLLHTEKPAAPTECVLKGKVEAGAIRLKAEFAGTTDHDNTLVALACSQAGASAAETNGHTALIRRSESGDFLVRIEKAGEYSVQLDLLVPLAAREGNGRGFELTLPRAVITQLELDLPTNSKEVRVGGRTLDEPQLFGLTLNDKHHLSGNPGLGPVEKLNLSWKEVRKATGDPVRIAEGRIQAQVDSKGLTTEAELVLKVDGAPTDVWRLLVPLKAEIKVLPPDDTRVKSPIEIANQKYASLRTIHLKERSADPLHLQIRVPPAPRTAALMPVGPFIVLDAARQTGTVVVRNPVRNLHLDYHRHGDMRLLRQETEEKLGESPARVATFEYSNIPQVEKPKDFSGPSSLSWLDMEARTVRPQVRTRLLSHSLILRHSSEQGVDDRRDSGPTEWHWQVVTTITPAANKWSDIDQLKILVPPAWQPLDENISVVGNSNSRYVTIPSFVLHEQQGQPLRLEGQFRASHKGEGRTVLKLPRPQGIIEACEVKIEAPADAEVIVNDAERTNLELSKQSRPNEQSWHYRGVPANGLEIDVGWRPYRPALRVRSVVDLTLNDSRGKVRQDIWLQLPAAPPPSLVLRVPPAVHNLQVEGENAADRHDVSVGPDGMARLPIAAKAGAAEWRRVLHYMITPGENDRQLRAGAPFALPLVVPKQATTGDIRVRVWSEPGFLPRLTADPHWEERGIEEVEGHDLPVLVLEATKLDAPLRLVLSEQAVGYSALVEAALVRVQLLEDGGQSWRASFQLRQLADHYLDIRLPAPAATLNAQFFFNGQKVTRIIVMDKGERADGGDIVRLYLPPLHPPGKPDLRQTALLEVSFQSPPARSGRSPLQTVLKPPQIRGAPAVPSRWQVSVPANRILIAPESASGVERTWTRRGWVPATQLQLTCADLQREFDKTLPEELRQDGKHLDSEAQTVPALVFWQDHSTPIVLTHAPQQAWLLVCSLGVLIVGLGLYWAARPRGAADGCWAVWLWPLLALLTLAIAVAVLFWPTTLWAIVYGCEPGLFVLLAVIVLQWLMHERYRRQIVFLPSFSRGRAGSSIVRKSSSARPHNGEPSTVDAPPPIMG
ncbi:MAG TPA: hypothetical protein VMG10_28235 [Gemmataceae bacterium]|nr:hypothetical protein [Gemmataceae bacterium]